jgi:hypothetical protein
MDMVEHQLIAQAAADVRRCSSTKYVLCDNTLA